MDKKDKELKNDIKDSLTCFICMEKLNNPLMCPKCKRLCCSDCIRKWFNDNNHICPFCKNQLNLDGMISLPFMNKVYDYFYKQVDNEEKKENLKKEVNLNEINESESDNDDELPKNIKPIYKSQLLPNNKNKIDQSPKDNHFKRIYKSDLKCPKHPSENLEYICLDCETKHCSKCLMITNNDSKLHKNHSIIPIDRYQTYNLEKLMNITKNFPSLTNILSDYNNNIITRIKICNKEEEIINDIKIKIHDIIDNKIQKMKNYLNGKMSEINSKIEEVNNISMTSKDEICSFIKRNDYIGLNEYNDEIIKMDEEIRKMNNFNIDNENKYLLKSNFNIYESEFNDIEIKKDNNEIYGDIQIKIEKKNYQMKIIPEGEEDVSFNFLINKEENTEYYVYCIIKATNNIYLLEPDNKIEQDNFVILNKYLSKMEFINLINHGHTYKIKFIVLSINN